MTMNSSDVSAGDDGKASDFVALRKDVLTGNKNLVTASDGATVTFDLDSSCVQKVTLAGNRTFAVSNMTAGQVLIIRIIQDATGSRTVTWFSTIKWADGVAPTLTTTATKTDVIGILCTGAGTYDGAVIVQNI